MRQGNVEGSYARYRRALELIPGGTQLIARRPWRFALGVSPVYYERAKGSRFWDVDGNEYVDLTMSVGALLLGYADDAVDDAAVAQIRRGTMTSVNCGLEVDLAEKLAEIIPCAEMVRYAKTGGETNAVAIRIARGVTGREKVLFCGYHGWHDWYLAANLGASDALASHLLPGIEPKGVPRGLAGTIYPFEFNNLASLEAALQEHEGQVACIIMEACRSTLPRAGFLEAVRELATRHGVVLIFDEVVTGFRLGMGGAQEHFGVTPDMATFAKAISNGYPMGAICGKREVMAAARDMFVSSTYWSDSVGLAAALATIRALRDRAAHEHIYAIGRRFQETFNQLAARHGVSAEAVGLPCLIGTRFYHDDPTVLKQIKTFYVQEMNRRGVFCGTEVNLSSAHTDADLALVGEAWDAVFGLLRDGLDRGDLESRLEVGVSVDGFQRLVH